MNSHPITPFSEYPLNAKLAILIYTKIKYWLTIPLLKYAFLVSCVALNHPTKIKHVKFKVKFFKPLFNWYSPRYNNIKNWVGNTLDKIFGIDYPIYVDLIDFDS